MDVFQKKTYYKLLEKRKQQLKEERKLSQCTFVIMDKDEYIKAKRLKDINDQTYKIQISENLEGTKATQLIKTCNEKSNCVIRKSPLQTSMSTFKNLLATQMSST